MAQNDFFNVEFDRFSGPIDLLLHLVKKNELPIEKLSLALVSKQYLDALSQLKELDIDLAGEYLVIAATLLSIKSSILLNKPIELTGDENIAADPADELLLRVQMAERFRLLASVLGARPQLGIDVFNVKSTVDQYGKRTSSCAPHDVALIKSAFLKAIARCKDQTVNYRVRLEPISIVDCMRSIVNKLSMTKKEMKFFDLLGQFSLSNLIAKFLAVLELTKQKLIYVIQVDNELCLGLRGDGYRTAEESFSELDIIDVASGA